eukprot:11771985-Ditylum_brightwellii.AAC.1
MEEDSIIPCTAYIIKGNLEYSNDMEKQVHFHYIVNGLQNFTLQSPLTSNPKMLKSNYDNKAGIKPTPETKPTPVTSIDSKPDEKPQFNYNIPAKIDLKTNRPINPLTMFKFEE